jgi:hypothetical protein
VNSSLNEYLRLPFRLQVPTSTKNKYQLDYQLLFLSPKVSFFLLRRTLPISFINKPLFELSLPKSSLYKIKMRYTSIIAAAFAAHVSAHGVITEIQGANGVNMPALSGMSFHGIILPVTSLILTIPCSHRRHSP